MLYPKLTFKDVTDRIEALASKKDFKVYKRNKCMEFSFNFILAINFLF